MAKSTVEEISCSKTVAGEIIKIVSKKGFRRLGNGEYFQNLLMRVAKCRVALPTVYSALYQLELDGFCKKEPDIVDNFRYVVQLVRY